MTIDRRRHLRVAVTDARVTLLVEGHDLGDCKVEDVSSSGAFIAHPSPTLPFRTRIDLYFRGPRKHDEFLVAGEVVQVIMPGGAHVSGYGVQFIGPPPDLVERVTSLTRGEAVVKRYDSAKPVPRAVTPKPDPAPAKSARDPDVLAVVAELDLGNKLQDLLGQHLIRVVVTERVEEGLAHFEAHREALEVLLLDLTFPQHTPMKLIGAFRRAGWKGRFLVMTDKVPDFAMRRSLQEAGAEQLLVKPLTGEDLSDRIRRFVRRRT